MGWSCRADASDVVNLWMKACLAQTNNQNLYRVGETTYFYEVSRTEHRDGAITGGIMKVVSTDPDGTMRAVPCGGFRINGDGSVARGPKMLKDAGRTWAKEQLGWKEKAV